MKKRILCLAMALMMMVGTFSTVQAKELVGKDHWKVSFDGSKMTTNFGKDQMNDELSNTLEEIELAIRKLPAKSQLPAAQTILDTLNQRNEATLLLKNAKKSTAPSHQDDDEER